MSDNHADPIPLVAIHDLARPERRILIREAEFNPAAHTIWGERQKPADVTPPPPPPPPVTPSVSVTAPPATPNPATPPNQDTQPPALFVAIPADWSDLPWPALKSLASKFGPSGNSDEARATIEAELAKRAAAGG